MRRGHGVEVVARAGRSSPTTCAPSRARASAMAAPMPREAPVTSATLPSSGRSQSTSGGSSASPDPHDLAGHVRRPRREQEAQRRVELALGAGVDVDQLHGGAGARLLAERAREALERALCGRLARVGHDSGGVPSTTIRPQRATRRTVGEKKRVQLAQLRRCPLMPVASKTSALKLCSRRLRVPDGGVQAGCGGGLACVAAELGRHGRAGAGEDARHRPGEPAARGGAEQDEPVDHRVARARNARAGPAGADRPGAPRGGRAASWRAWCRRRSSGRPSLLENGHHALAARGADADHAAALAALVQRLGQAGDDAPAGGGERVAGGQRAAVDVELGAVDRPRAARRGRGAACRTPGPPTPSAWRAPARRTPRGSRRGRSPAAPGRRARACAASRRRAPCSRPSRRPRSRRRRSRRSTNVASTGRPRSAAHSSVASSTTAAPSLSGVELPAVIVPSRRRRPA